MSEPVVISWNATNWITVVLMAALGFAVLGFGARVLKRRSAAAGSDEGGA
jgi:hypothetical protein